MARLAPRGTLLWLGQASRQPASLDFFAVVSAAPYASIVPFSYWRSGASDADDLATLVRLVAGGRLHPEIGLQADWRETPDVLVALRERRVRGKPCSRSPSAVYPRGPPRDSLRPCLRSISTG